MIIFHHAVPFDLKKQLKNKRMKLNQYIFDILGIDVHPEPIHVQ